MVVTVAGAILLGVMQVLRLVVILLLLALLLLVAVVAVVKMIPEHQAVLVLAVAVEQMVLHVKMLDQVRLDKATQGKQELKITEAVAAAVQVRLVAAMRAVLV
jgi:hypothetical protein